MRRFTVSDIVKLRPCGTYSRDVIKRLWDGRESLSAMEIGELDIPADDRRWALRNLLDNETDRRLFACDCAERALERCPEMGARLSSCVAVARRYALGQATEEERREARAAADAAAAAAAYAAYAAAAAAYAASDAAARHLEIEWLVLRLVEYIDGVTS